VIVDMKITRGSARLPQRSLFSFRSPVANGGTRHPFSHLARLSLLAGCLAVVGCRQEHFCDTVVRSDGSIQRTVAEPFEMLSNRVWDPKRWDQVTYASGPDEIKRWGWPNAIKQLPRRQPRGGNDYVVARVDVRSVLELPEHLIMKPPEGIDVPAGRLVRAYARTDCGFVVEHRWSETLTDCVNEGDMKQARGELADLAIRLAHETFQEVYGDRYDATRLVHWLKSEGTACFYEITDVMFDRALARDNAAREAKLLTLWERRGLVLKKDGRFLKGPEVSERLGQLAEELLLRTLRTKDGKPLDREAVKQIIAAITNPSSATDSPMTMQQAFETKVVKRYGGSEALQLRLLALLVRVVGLYQFPFGRAGFDAIVSVPGVVVETNGQTMAANRVRWQFDAAEAYPFGFTMSCRSLEPDEAMIKQLGVRPFADRAAMKRYVELVSPHEGLRAALVKCRQAQRLDPLTDFAATIAGKPEASKERAALAELRALLKLDEPAGAPGRP
jgi:hypothetical protein